MRIEITEHVDFRHEEPSRGGRRISLRLCEPDDKAVFLPRSVIRTLTPDDARRLAARLIAAADGVDAVRVIL